MIDNIYKNIGIEQPDVVDLLRDVQEHPKTWDVYKNGNTLGVNQVEQEKTAVKCQRYQPKNISELSYFVAAVRPGFVTMLDRFLNREDFKYGIPILDELLSNRDVKGSYLAFQEQIMVILQRGGLTGSESYKVIKAISKKKEKIIKSYYEKFSKGFVEYLISTGSDEESAKHATDECWKVILDSAQYLFNGCVPGDTVIMREWAGRKNTTITVEQMYNIMHDSHYAKVTGHRSLHDKYKREGYGIALSLCEDNRIRSNRIVDIRFVGDRPVYEIATASGAIVRCSDRHKFPVKGHDEMVEAEDLQVGDVLYKKGEYEKCTKAYNLTDKNSVSNIPSKGQMGFQKKTDAPYTVFTRFRETAKEKNRSCDMCGKPYRSDTRFEIHHIDNDHTHNSEDNYMWLCVSCHKKIHYRQLDRAGKYSKGIPAIEDEIVSIKQCGWEPMYDVEMAAPFHNFVIQNGIVVGNSHAVAMALDSLYVAYPKMYWPIETYTALLNIYNDRGDDKDKIERCKKEMFDVAGIKCVPCQFRKDNKKFTYDKEKNVIYDVLGSMKGMPKATEEIMSKYADQPFELFTDLLYELFKNGDLKPATIETLIQADYFSEFGKNGKLLQVFYEFTKRKHRISKQLKDTTIETRYVWLRENERMLPDESLDIQSQLLFETSVFGNPKSLKKECRGWYFVTELSEKFPKIITMYRVDTGTVGQMKMAKKTFEKDPLVVGDMFKVVSYNTSPAYRYKKDPVTGESIRTVDSTKKDLWLNSFTRVAE